MSDLFDIPPSTPPKLTQLRQAYENARVAYDEACNSEDEYGTPIPSIVKLNLVRAGQELMEEEQREIKHS